MSSQSIPAALCRQALVLLKKEGPIALFKRAVAFFAYVCRRAVLWRTVYLYEHALVPRDRNAFLPRLGSWEMRILHSNEEADSVVAEGFEDVREAFVFAHRSLETGAVAFCVYAGRELAHVGWLAVDARGKRAVDGMPFEVAFESGQACTGGTYTIPKYRGKGLMPYGYYERFEYLRSRGFTTSRNSVEVSNVSSQKAHAKFNPTIYGIGKYRKVLWWKRWRVEALPGGPFIGMPPVPSSGHR